MKTLSVHEASQTPLAAPSRYRWLDLPEGVSTAGGSTSDSQAAPTPLVARVVVRETSGTGRRGV
jgi:hypothetical protein